MVQYLQHLTDSIGIALSRGATQAGIALGHLWMVLIRQEIILGSIGVGSGVLLLIGVLILLRISRKVFQAKIDSWDKGALIAIILSIALFTTMNAITFTIQSLPHLLNPEYYAVQDAIGILSQLKQ